MPRDAERPASIGTDRPVCREITDRLLLAAGRGDVLAFADFYDLTAPLIFTLLRRRLGKSGEAEQATHQVYLELWRRAPRFDPAAVSAFSMLLLLAHRELLGHTAGTLPGPGDDEDDLDDKG